MGGVTSTRSALLRASPPRRVSQQSSFRMRTTVRKGEPGKGHTEGEHQPAPDSCDAAPKGSPTAPASKPAASSSPHLTKPNPAAPSHVLAKAQQRSKWPPSGRESCCSRSSCASTHQQVSSRSGTHSAARSRGRDRGRTVPPPLGWRHAPTARLNTARDARTTSPRGTTRAARRTSCSTAAPAGPPEQRSRQLGRCACAVLPPRPAGRPVSTPPRHTTLPCTFERCCCSRCRIWRYAALPRRDRSTT